MEPIEQIFKMEPEQKTITLRLPVRFYNELTENETKKLNPTLIEFLERCITERKVRYTDIKGVFSTNEWFALAAALNGTIVDDIMRYNPDVFCAHCEDAELYEHSFSRFGVDVKDFCQRARQLTRIQISTVCERVSDFWNNQNGIGVELSEWAKF